jgi:hypothetical protein
MAQIDTLRTLLQIDDFDSSQDALLNELIEQCEAEYLRRTHQNETDKSIVNAMVIEKYNRLGNEGVQSIGYSGINETYESDYSESVQKLIRSKTRLVTL